MIFIYILVLFFSDIVFKIKEGEYAERSESKGV